MPYWTLFQRYDGGQWGPEFGSDEKADVDSERRDMIDGHHNVRAADLKIVRFAKVPSQSEVMARARELQLDSPRRPMRRNPAGRWFIFLRRPDGSWQHAHTLPSKPQAFIRAHKYRKAGQEVEVFQAAGETAAKAKMTRNPAPPARSSGRLYIVRDGERVYFATIEAAQRAAQKLANLLGRGVRVSEEGPARMRRNPDPGSFLPVWNEQAKHRAARQAYGKATKARRLAKGLRGRKGDPDAQAGARKTAKFVVEARNRREAFTLYRASRAAADRLADQFEAAGYSVAVSAA